MRIPLLALLSLCLVVSSELFAKSYDLTVTPCDVGSNCKNCYEVIKMTYTVDTKTKQVTMAGNAIDGKLHKETNDKCKVSDENNWVCESFFVMIQAKNGIINITNRSHSSSTSSKKEICIVK
jgi:hypothetical protein